MTSQTSFVKPHRGGAGWHPFLSAFGIGAVIVNTAALVVFLFLPYTGIDTLVSTKIQYPDMIYYLLPNYRISLLAITLAAEAMVTAWMMFGFLHNKRTATAYLSLPVTRGHMFASRYFAGLILILTPSLLFMLWSYWLNIRVFGYTAALGQAFLLITGGMMIALFTVYSIMTAICLCVGTAAEGFIFSLVVIFGVLFLSAGANNLFHVFLHGNAFGEMDSANMWLLPDFVSIAGPFMPFLGVMFFLDQFGEWQLPLERFKIPFLDARGHGVAVLLFWLAVSIVVSILARAAFKRFKAENAAVLGISRVWNFICEGILVSFMFTLGYSAVNAFVIGQSVFAFIISLITFLLCRFLLTLNVKKALHPRGLAAYALMLAIPFAIILVCVTGFFGYRSYRPDAEQILEAFITYTGAADFVSGEGFETGNSYVLNRAVGESDIRVFNYQNLTFTSKRDIETVLDLHQQLIDAGAGLFSKRTQNVEDKDRDRLRILIRVSYQLKDGTIVERLYKSVPARIVEEMLRLDETDAIKSRMDGNIKWPLPEGFGPVAVTDRLYGHAHFVNAEDYEALFDALRQDIADLNHEDKYFASQPVHAIISFPRSEANGSNGITASSETILTVSGDGLWIAGNAFNLGPSTNNVKHYITDRYPRTLALLADMNLTPAPVEAMCVERRRTNPAFTTQAPYFRSYRVERYTPHRYAYAVEPNEYANMLNLARNAYYAAEGGYNLWVKTSGEDGTAQWTALFIPEADAPPFIRDKGLK